MKKIKTNIFKTLFAISFIALFVNCTDDSDSAGPDLNFVDSVSVTLIDNPADAIERIRFLYDHVPFRWGLYYFIPEVLSNEITSELHEFLPFSSFNDLTPDKDFIPYMWDGSYKSIALAESYIQAATNNSNAEFAQDQYLGQAYFYQGLAYFTCFRAYGKFYPEKDFNAAGIPIVSMDTDAVFDRKTIQENYDHIINIFANAAQLLPESDPVSPTKYAALALAAKTHMWVQKYDEAAILLEEIINSGNYNLLPNYADLFNGVDENTAESIFEFQFYADGNFWYSEGVPAAQRYGSQISTTRSNEGRANKVSDFTKTKLGNDPRATETYYAQGETMYTDAAGTEINEGGYPNLKKYAIKNASFDYQGTNICLIRLAEIYLMYAEIQIQQGNSAKAAEYINMVRSRAGVSPIASPTMDDLMNEKFLELCCEGVYWYDIIRWDKAEELLSNSGFVRGKNEALPIPAFFIESNSDVVQNPGY